MSRILNILAKLASDLDELEAVEFADQVDDISAVMTGVDVASGQHMPAGDTQWSLPSVGVNMSKDAMGLNDIPIGDAPYANREGVPEDDIDTQFLGGDEEGVSMPTINDKYQMDLKMDDHLDSLEAFFFDQGLRKRAFSIHMLRRMAAEFDAGIEWWNFLVPYMVPMKLGGELRNYTLLSIYEWASSNPEVQTELERLYSEIREDREILTGLNLTDADLDAVRDGTKEIETLIVERRVHASNFRKAQIAGNRYKANIARVKQIASAAPDLRTSEQDTGTPDTRQPSASGPRTGRPDTPGPQRGSGQSGSSALAELQTRLNVTSDGIWGDITSGAWESFIDATALPFLRESGQEPTDTDISNMKTNWGAAAGQLGYAASYQGMVDFFDAVSSGEGEAPETPETPETPEAPEAPGEPEAPETAPVSEDEIKQILLGLAQNKVDHMMEAAGKDPEVSLGRGYSMRRTKRYIRHLDKLVEGDGDAYAKVAQLLAEEYGDELTQTLVDAEAYHKERTEADDQHAEPWDESHRQGHLVSKVYELLQRVWGDLNSEAGRGGRDRRSERRQKRQDNRGRRRLRNQE